MNKDTKALTPDDVPDEMTITLRKPIVLQDRTISEITLSEPTAMQIQQVAKRAASDPAGSNILLVSLVSGLTEPEVGKIKISDLNKGLKYLQVFIDDDPEIGKT
jgi:hypothetical protein